MESQTGYQFGCLKEVKNSFCRCPKYLEDDKPIHKFIYLSRLFFEVLRCQKLKKIPLEHNHDGAKNLS